MVLGLDLDVGRPGYGLYRLSDTVLNVGPGRAHPGEDMLATVRSHPRIFSLDLYADQAA